MNNTKPAPKEPNNAAKNLVPMYYPMFPPSLPGIPEAKAQFEQMPIMFARHAPMTTKKTKPIITRLVSFPSMKAYATPIHIMPMASKYDATPKMRIPTQAMTAPKIPIMF